jgi:hypothetical protein
MLQPTGRYLVAFEIYEGSEMILRWNLIAQWDAIDITTLKNTIRSMLESGRHGLKVDFNEEMYIYIDSVSVLPSSPSQRKLKIPPATPEPPARIANRDEGIGFIQWVGELFSALLGNR